MAHKGSSFYIRSRILSRTLGTALPITLFSFDKVFKSLVKVDIDSSHSTWLTLQVYLKLVILKPVQSSFSFVCIQYNTNCFHYYEPCNCWGNIVLFLSAIQHNCKMFSIRNAKKKKKRSAPAASINLLSLWMNKNFWCCVHIQGDSRVTT